ncbi:MAG: hypothetical protein PVI11_00730 [Candidatus Aminicenantes bacterium]
MKRKIPEDGEKDSVKKIHLMGIAVLALLLTVMGSSACKQEGEEVEAGKETSVSVKEGMIEFEGTVEVAQGQYIYIPQAQGFDIIVQGALVSGDISSLIDKEVRGEGQFLPEVPSVLVANTLDVKEESGDWTNVFTRSEELSLGDLFDLKTRDEFAKLDELSYDEKEYWEEFEKGKVRGQLEETDGNYKIAVLNDEDSQIGKIVVDNMSDLAKYYVNKLKLFDHLWFYLTIKDTVEWNDRRSTREMFHADILFAGLF